VHKVDEKYRCKHGSSDALFSSYGPKNHLKHTGFCLWGFLKSIVYSSAVNDVAELQQRGGDGC
jgi:hypothetical protein